MEELLAGLSGKFVELNCGQGVMVGGDVVDVRGGLVALKTDDGRVVRVSIDKIIAVFERNEHPARPGFVS
jgi:hypothetical protein